jgi:hypothetical protein
VKRLLPALFLLGCSAGTPDVVEDTWILESSPAPLDLLFVVDDSNSMADAQDNLGFAWPQLRAELDAGAIDWQVGITTTDFDAAEGRGRLVPIGDGRLLDADTPNGDAAFADAARVGTEGSQLERGLATGLAAVRPPLTSQDNAGLLRGGRLAVVFVSDEDDCSDGGELAGGDAERCATSPDSLVPVRDLVADFKAVLDNPEWATLHAIVEPGERAGVASCGLTAPGERYMQAAGRSGGVVLGLCGDLRPAMTALGTELAGSRSSYPLTRYPDEATLEVEVDGAAVAPDPAAANGWTWDAEANAIRLWGADIPLPGASVTVRYASATR